MSRGSFFIHLVAESCLTLSEPTDCILDRRQAPLSVGFSRQEYPSGFHFLLQETVCVIPNGDCNL